VTVVVDADGDDGDDVGGNDGGAAIGKSEHDLLDELSIISPSSLTSRRPGLGRVCDCCAFDALRGFCGCGWCEVMRSISIITGLFACNGSADSAVMDGRAVTGTVELSDSNSIDTDIEDTDDTEHDEESVAFGKSAGF